MIENVTKKPKFVRKTEPGNQLAGDPVLLWRPTGVGSTSHKVDRVMVCGGFVPSNREIVFHFHENNVISKCLVNIFTIFENPENIRF